MAKGMGAIMAIANIALNSDRLEEKAKQLLSVTPWGTDCPLCQRKMDWNDVVYVCNCLRGSDTGDLSNRSRLRKIWDASKVGESISSYAMYHPIIVINDEKGEKVAELGNAKGGAVWDFWGLKEYSGELKISIEFPDWWPEDLEWDETLFTRREEANEKAMLEAEADRQLKEREKIVKEKAKKQEAQTRLENALSELGFFRESSLNGATIPSNALVLQINPIYIIVSAQISHEQLAKLVELDGGRAELKSKPPTIYVKQPGKWIGTQGKNARFLSTALKIPRLEIKAKG